MLTRMSCAIIELENKNHSYKYDKEKSSNFTNDKRF